MSAQTKRAAAAVHDPERKIADNVGAGRDRLALACASGSDRAVGGDPPPPPTSRRRRRAALRHVDAILHELSFSRCHAAMCKGFWRGCQDFFVLICRNKKMLQRKENILFGAKIALVQPGLLVSKRDIGAAPVFDAWRFPESALFYRESGNGRGVHPCAQMVIRSARIAG